MHKYFVWKIRQQILSAGLVSLVVVLGIIYYFYSYTASSLQDSSLHMIELVSNQAAEAVNRSLEERSRTFVDWTRDDIFGLSIEFNTTTELHQRFEEWLRGNSGYCLMALVDRSGRVIESAWDPQFSGRATALKGGILPEISGLSFRDDMAAVFVESKTLADHDAPYAGTFLLTRQAYSSSGERNGMFVAFLDWAGVSDALANELTSLHEFDFTNAQVAMMLSSVPKPVGWHGKTGLWTADQLAGWSSHLGDIGSEKVATGSFAGLSVLSGTRALSLPDIMKAGSGEELRGVIGIAVPESDITAQLVGQVINILLIGLLGVAVVGALSWIIANRITRRLHRIAQTATAMSKGDIECDLHIHSGDEIGQLAEAFRELSAYLTDMVSVASRIAERDLSQKVAPRSEKDVLGRSFGMMVDNLSDIIRQLGENARELSSASSEIASTSEQMANGMTEQAARVGEISSTIEEMTATILHSSTNANEASSASLTASTTAAAGGETVRDTIRGMQTIADVTRQSGESIARLASSADEIGRIVAVIDDIADQTNLLALNAAIEAARAGEQGRGFAVVADEVRKLAERTSSATSEIGDMIRGIQKQTEEAVNSAEAGVQEIDKGRALADKAGTALNEIVTVSQQVKDMIQQIASASTQQSLAAEQMSTAIQQISSTTRQAADGASQSAAAAEELNRQADSLEKIVAQFRVAGDK
jgi:methyl-accepting chemotaxis protein